MSYERDPDRSTRGPGAIAALDRAGGRRDQRRLLLAQATIARDRAMSRVTSGALGRIDIGNKGGGSGRSPPPSKIPIRVAAPPPPPPPMPMGPVLTRFPDLPPPPPPTPMGPVLTRFPPTDESPPIMKPPLPVIISPPASEPPTLALPPIPAPAPGGGRSGGGGMSSGSGTVMTTGGSGPPIQVTVGPDVPLPEAAEDQADHTTRNLLLVGGGALALYLLLRDRGGR